MKTVCNFSTFYDHYTHKTIITIKYKKQKLKLLSGKGTNDYLKVFIENNDIIIFTWNPGLDYAGVEIYPISDIRDREEYVECSFNNEIFAQGAWRIKEICQLKRQWDEYSPITLAKGFYSHYCEI